MLNGILSLYDLNPSIERPFYFLDKVYFTFSGKITLFFLIFRLLNLNPALQTNFMLIIPDTFQIEDRNIKSVSQN